MIALALLAAAASAGLSAPWWLALLSLGWLASCFVRASDPAPAMTQPAEEKVAVIYERAGRLVMRRVRKA